MSLKFQLKHYRTEGFGNWTLDLMVSGERGASSIEIGLINQGNLGKE